MILYLKVSTAFVIGQPITKDVVGSKVTSQTSEIQSDNHTSDRGTLTYKTRIKNGIYTLILYKIFLYNSNVHKAIWYH